MTQCCYYQPLLITAGCGSGSNDQSDATDDADGTLDPAEEDAALPDGEEKLDDSVVLTIDIHDFTDERILTSRTVRRTEFTGTFAYQSFSLDADLAGCGARAGHVLDRELAGRRVHYGLHRSALAE